MRSRVEMNAYRSVPSLLFVVSVRIVILIRLSNAVRETDIFNRIMIIADKGMMFSHVASLSLYVRQTMTTIKKL